MFETSYEKAQVLKILLEVKEEIVFPFEGSSMLPTIKRKAKLLVRKLESIELDRIYVFFLHEADDPFPRLVCHRLVKIEEENHYFKGDNRESLEIVNKDAILGVVSRWS